jgi:hypothetical protein
MNGKRPSPAPGKLPSEPAAIISWPEPKRGAQESRNVDSGCSAMPNECPTAGLTSTRQKTSKVAAREHLKTKLD